MLIAEAYFVKRLELRVCLRINSGCLSLVRNVFKDDVDNNDSDYDDDDDDYDDDDDERR